MQGEILLPSVEFAMEKVFSPHLLSIVGSETKRRRVKRSHTRPPEGSGEVGGRGVVEG